MEKKLLDAFAALGNSIAAAIPGIAVGILLIIAWLGLSPSWLKSAFVQCSSGSALTA